MLKLNRKVFSFIQIVILSAYVPASFAFNPGNHDAITQSVMKKDWKDAPKTLKLMAGNGSQDSINSNDQGIFEQMGWLHCDNADYLEPKYNGGASYPQTKQKAHAQLHACVKSAYAQFKKAVIQSNYLVDKVGKTIHGEVAYKKCLFDDKIGQAKCTVIEALGRMMHIIEDFYAHSNQVDVAGKGSVGVKNPPGLQLTAKETPFLFSSFQKDPSLIEDPAKFERLIHSDFSTGCYPDLNADNVIQKCGTSRVTHNSLTSRNNPGNGTGLSKDGTNFERAQIALVVHGKNMTNFDVARQEAINDVAAAWNSFKTALMARYGEKRADGMLHALAHDY